MNTEKKPLTVMITNVLAQARHSLTLQEKRLITLSIAKSHPTNFVSGVRITAEEFSKQFNILETNAYEFLKTATKELFHRYVSFREKDCLTQMHWVITARYEDQKGAVFVKFHPDIVPQLFNLKREFTKYELSTSKALRSPNSWRLMELLECYYNLDTQDKKGFNFYEAPLEDMHKAFEISVAYQKKYNDFKKRILEPATKELNKKTGWQVSFKEKKRGRKVIGIRFIFKKKIELDTEN